MEVFFFLLKAYLQDESQRRQTQFLKQEAVEKIKNELKTAVETGNEKAEAGLLLNLGNVYAYYADFSLSDTMYRQALAIARETTDKNLEITALVNLGLSYKLRTDYALAFSYYQKAIKIADETGDRELKQQILEHIHELNNMIDIEKLSNEQKQ